MCPFGEVLVWGMGGSAGEEVDPSGIDHQKEKQNN